MKFTFKWLLLSLIYLYSFFLTIPTSADQKLHSEIFGELTLYKPLGEIKGSVLFFSGDGGWNEDEAFFADILRQNGIFVVGIDSAHYLKHIAQDQDECYYLAGEIERLAQSAQKSAGLKSFSNVLLLGYSSGATIVYSILAQHDQEFRGGVSISYCPGQEFGKPLCADEQPLTQIQHNGRYRITKALQLSRPWLVYHGSRDRTCSWDKSKEFVSSVKVATFTSLHGQAHGLLDSAKLRAEVLKQIEKLLNAPMPQIIHSSESLDLPLIEMPTEMDAADTFAIFLSGDGGWASIDKGISQILQSHGISVLGFDSLHYFWKSRTADESAKDLTQIINLYSKKWHKSKVILIGFSLGADALTLIAPKLSTHIRDKVEKYVLLSPDQHSDLEVHISGWLGMDDPDGATELLPQLQKINGNKILCIYGEYEATESLCTQKIPQTVTPIKVPGSHHFNGDYKTIANLLLKK